MLYRVALFALLLTCGCGVFENIYENANYESITNERGTVHVYSGGVEIATYVNATVLYADAGSQAMFIQANGQTFYIQGDLIMELQP